MTFLNLYIDVANVKCSVLNGKSADVPEDIVEDWSLRFPRSATATRYTLKAIFRVDDTVTHCCMWIHVFRSAHVINSQVPRGRPSLLYDHTNAVLSVVVKEGFYCI